jgi:hypothetical protein
VRRLRWLLVTALLVVVGCAADLERSVPEFTVRGDGEPLVLRAWTFCNDHGCADGMPPDNPAGVGSPSQVRVRFSEPGWALTAEFEPRSGGQCARSFSVPLTQVADGEWVLDPAGPAGTYHVTLGANGNPYGDAVATFRWTTRTRGTMPAPRAQLLTEYFEMHVSNLATTPKEGSLLVTMTAADEKTVVIRPEQSRPEGEGATCTPVGRIDFYAADPGGKRDLGPPPRRYEVRLTLDGTDYRASAVMPRDSKYDGHEYVDLAFTPPLPAFTG